LLGSSNYYLVHFALTLTQSVLNQGEVTWYRNINTTKLIISVTNVTAANN